MTISAEIIADSISVYGKRITTFILRYPRFIHAELMTHRLFSRNASSSRAIPVERLIADIVRDPAMPIYWGSNRPGMQAGAELDEMSIEICKGLWIDGMKDAIQTAKLLVNMGLHKQIANRILEPWAHINVIVTATEYANFFSLRSHPAAQPEIKLLSDLMQDQMAYNSQPIELQPGQWHLPFVRLEDWWKIKDYCKANRITRDEPDSDEMLKLALKVSTARCARVSYLTHDGRETGIEEDIALHDMLVVAIPLHASPAEHQATPDDVKEWQSYDGEGSTEPVWACPELHGNLVGWQQHRKLLQNEFIPG